MGQTPGYNCCILTASDHIGNGKLINYYPRRNLIGKDILNDGLMIEYVNCSYKGTGSTCLETLIKDLNYKDPLQMRIPALRKRCSEIKKTKGGNLIVSELIERVYGDHLRAVEKEMEIKMRKEMEIRMRKEMETKIHKAIQKEMQKEQETLVVRMFSQFRMYFTDLSDAGICQRISDVCGIRKRKVLRILTEIE